jgi:hypothetical protein
LYEDHLTYLTDHKGIDIGASTGLAPLLFLLKETRNEREVWEVLLKYNIRYFLVPKKNNWFYQFYERAYHDTNLYTTVYTYGTLIKEFTTYYLYELNAEPPREIQLNLSDNILVPWNYNPSAPNKLQILADGTVQFTGYPNEAGYFTLMYDPNINLDPACIFLELDVETHAKGLFDLVVWDINGNYAGTRTMIKPGDNQLAIPIGMLSRKDNYFNEHEIDRIRIGVYIEEISDRTKIIRLTIKNFTLVSG